MKWPLLLPNLLPKPFTSGPEQLIDGIGLLLAKHRQDMRVGIHRDPDLRLPEHVHDGPRGHTLAKLVMSGLPTMLNRSVAEYGGGGIGQGW
jgi:hypothetical protein